MRKKLGKLELQVMNLIWDKGKATVREIWEVLYPQKGLAYTTVATVMRKLEEKGFLAHETVDRTYVYYPLVDRDEVTRGVLRELIKNFFNGSAAELVSALIRTGELSERELERVRRMIEHREGER